MANPTLLDMPIARDGNKNTIPITDNGTTGLLSQQYGWQLINAIPPQQGGRAVKREDFNGALYLLSNLLFYLQKGWQFEWNSSQAYYAGCIVKDASNGKMYQCLNDVTNTTAPHSDSTNWKLWDLSAYLPLVGGTMTGDIAISDGTYIKSTANDSKVEIWGGAGPNSGANLTVFGANRTDGLKGVAELRAFIAGQNANLLCYPDGRLHWNNNDLGASAIVAESIDGGSGYRKTADGLIIQWGKSTSDNSVVQVDFPITFKIDYHVIASIESIMFNTAENFEVRCYNESNSFFKAYVKHNGSPADLGFSWLAIGR